MPEPDAGDRTGLLPDAVRAFLAERHYAVLATLDPDGSPRQAVVWYRLEPDGAVTVNSRVGRRWPRNLGRDPRLALAVMDEAEPTRWVGTTGCVEAVVDDQAVAQADIADLARRYDPPQDAEASIADFRTQRRISFRVRLDEVHQEL
ncbi:MAG TPA: TIGR03618 family F420-dependent PPOX class oxidoreductase [Candidatus Dormibacteraeota bacterium]|nr:TIGR03618 family F420-dependent PPOX class oxidoreductase [Candidatus Dormibacteraeota bacterium]